jgi:rhodanese-related sulfurtransferase
VHLPVSDLMANLRQLPTLDQLIVVYCASGHRGGIALDALGMVGYTNVRNLGGGMGAWVAAELPVVK